MKIMRTLRIKTDVDWGKALQWITIGLVSLFIFTQLFEVNISIERRFARQKTEQNIEAVVTPAEGVRLPVRWGDLGKQLIESGTIDKDKFEALYAQRGGIDEKLLYGEDNGNVIMTAENSGFLLNLLWAFGLANENSILQEGPMQDERYGGAGRFASTGGWSLSQGDAMDHYGVHAFVSLTSTQQELVERVSKNIYRPCCGNSTYFPDCNHGMAMLGLLELMASQGIGEEEMYKVALQVNSYWFPGTYLTLAKYFEKRGVMWENVDAREVLGSLYSSAGGYAKIRAELEPVQAQRGASCGV